MYFCGFINNNTKELWWEICRVLFRGEGDGKVVRDYRMCTEIGVAVACTVFSLQKS
jgi:hypothetical protein